MCELCESGKSPRQGLLQLPAHQFNRAGKSQIPIYNDQNLSWQIHRRRIEYSNFGHWDLPFDFAQGGELVEPFDIWSLLFGISIGQ